MNGIQKVKHQDIPLNKWSDMAGGKFESIKVYISL